MQHQEPLSKRLVDASAFAIIFFILFYFAQELNLIPNLNTALGLTLTTVFILGLVASVSTCMATTGALYIATIGSRNLSTSFLPAFGFITGRILSYGFFGFVLGFFGKTLSQNLQLGQFLSMFVAVFLVLIGLDMARLISFQKFLPIPFKKLFLSLEDRFSKKPQSTAFFLGATTYLLPCGFTQAVQVYALGLADPIKSAAIMAVFAIGTAPALIGIGFTSSKLSRSSYYHTFSKAMGVLVFMIGISYVNNTLALNGIEFSTGQSVQGAVKNVAVQNGVQIASMNVNSRGYYPASFTVKKDVPVRWIINGENVFGCQGSLVVPKIGVQKILSTGENIIEFTPKEEGTIIFSCGMGMYRGRFNVI